MDEFLFLLSKKVTVIVEIATLIELLGFADFVNDYFSEMPNYMKIHKKNEFSENGYWPFFFKGYTARKLANRCKLKQRSKRYER